MNIKVVINGDAVAFKRLKNNFERVLKCKVSVTSFDYSSYEKTKELFNVDYVILCNANLMLFNELGEKTVDTITNTEAVTLSSSVSNVSDFVIINVKNFKLLDELYEKYTEFFEYDESVFLRIVEKSNTCCYDRGLLYAKNTSTKFLACVFDTKFELFWNYLEEFTSDFETIPKQYSEKLSELAHNEFLLKFYELLSCNNSKSLLKICFDSFTEFDDKITFYNLKINNWCFSSFTVSKTHKLYERIFNEV